MKKRFLNKILGVGLVTCMLMASGASAFAEDVRWTAPNSSETESRASFLRDPRIKEFPDVPKEHFARESIDFCSMWLMQGKEDGKFYPDAFLSRAEAVQILRNASHSTPVKTNAAFSDVKPGEWYYEALSFAVQQKLCSGFPDGSFKPHQKLTYEQFAVMIFNYMKWQYPVWFEANKYGQEKLKYAKYSDYAKEALDFGQYLIKSIDLESKDATKPITRAEAAIFAHKAESTQLEVFNPGK